MALNATTIQATLDKLVAAIDTLASNPESLFDYKDGERSVKKSMAFETLVKASRALTELLLIVPGEEIDHFAIDIDPRTGVDSSQYVGEDVYPEG